jgi:hypothetical protein
MVSLEEKTPWRAKVSKIKELEREVELLRKKVRLMERQVELEKAVEKWPKPWEPTPGPTYPQTPQWPHYKDFTWW